MKSMLVRPLLLYFLLMFSMLPVQAVRYAGDLTDAPGIDNLLKVLNIQQGQLENLMDMLSRLDEWKKKLSSDNQHLAAEGELAKQDRKKFESGKLTEDDLNKKWHMTGRSVKHGKALQSFQQEVVEFNAYVKEYNLLATKMSHVLNNRSPSQVKLLIGEMRKLVRILREAMNDGNIEKARYIARKSALAVEFGYSAD